jgi:hypothetical protein
MTGVWHAVGMSSTGGRKEAWLHLHVDCDGRLTGHEARHTEACVLDGECSKDRCRFTQTSADDESVIWTARLTPANSHRMVDGVWEGAHTGFFEAVRVAAATEHVLGDSNSRVPEALQGNGAGMDPIQLEQPAGQGDASYLDRARISLSSDATEQQPSLLSVEREVERLAIALASADGDTRDKLEQQSRELGAKFNAEQKRLTEAHANQLRELSEQHHEAAETRLDFVKAAHAREIEKLTEKLEITRCVAHVASLCMILLCVLCVIRLTQLSVRRLQRTRLQPSTSTVVAWTRLVRGMARVWF